MKVKCISSRLTQENIEKLGDEYYQNRDFHITEGKDYLVIGLTMNVQGSDGVGTWLELISDYDGITSCPIYLFDVMDSRSSRYWSVKKFEDGTVTLWPPSFYQQYYHDDLSEGVPEIVEDFKKVREKLEEEFVSPL